MRAPSFWWSTSSIRSALLAPLGWLVGGYALRRMSGSGRRPPLPVVCIGNFVAGGAGKTPTAIAIALLAIENGMKPVFLTRGYGGHLKGPLLADLDRHTAADVGDEALLLGKIAPTVVSRDRVAAFDLLASLGADLCLMDDGFQNPSVAKALSLVVVDGKVGIGTGRVIPAGPLRAPLRPQMAKADAIVVVGDGEGGKTVVRAAARMGKPVLRARLDQRDVAVFGDRPVFAWAGIGRPEKFFDQLDERGLKVVGRRSFPDHHPLTGLEAREVLNAARALGAVPVTTEKDAVRLANASSGPRAELASRSVAVGVDCILDAPDRVLTMLREARVRWRDGG